MSLEEPGKDNGPGGNQAKSNLTKKMECSVSLQQSIGSFLLLCA